uniref:Putative ovule protein n=1 Tax=Solanum chacoense TaxID=4108 RepID=A0A0V0GLQ9_SOLCH
MYDAPFSGVCTMNVLSPLCSDVKSSPGIVLLTSCIGEKSITGLFLSLLFFFQYSTATLHLCSGPVLLTCPTSGIHRKGLKRLIQ